MLHKPQPYSPHNGRYEVFVELGEFPLSYLEHIPVPGAYNVAAIVFLEFFV